MQHCHPGLPCSPCFNASCCGSQTLHYSLNSSVPKSISNEIVSEFKIYKNIPVLSRLLFPVQLTCNCSLQLLPRLKNVTDHHLCRMQKATFKSNCYLQFQIWLQIKMSVSKLRSPQITTRKLYGIAP